MHIVNCFDTSNNQAHLKINYKLIYFNYRPILKTQSFVNLLKTLTMITIILT